MKVTVTGGNRGIGAAVAGELRRKNHEVVIVHKVPESSLEKEGHYCADLSDPARAEQVFREIGEMDALVCCAGSLQDRTVAKMEPGEFEQAFRDNLNTAFYSIKYARVRDGGRVVLLGSIIGRTGNFGQVNYASAKAGLVGLAATAGRELARRRINVVHLELGFVDAGMTKALPEDIKSRLKDRISMGRFASAEEVAAMIRFLVEEGTFFCGDTVQMTGGWLG